jgi:hypothetical protein
MTLYRRAAGMTHRVGHLHRTPVACDILRRAGIYTFADDGL